MALWISIGLETGVPWPIQPIDVEFKGHKLLLEPNKSDRLGSYSCLHFEYSESGLTREEALRLCREFMRTLAWVHRTRVVEKMTGGGSIRMGFGTGGPSGIATHEFDSSFIPEVSDKKAKLAMAFYREALGLDSAPYKFLSFYKIVNILHEGGKAQEQWINETSRKIIDRGFQDEVNELQQKYKVQDLGKYLHGSNRCAVAHSFNQPLVDPDSSEDLERLEASLTIMQLLVEYAIEHEFTVTSSATFQKERSAKRQKDSEQWTNIINCHSRN